jgi:hypothetical protein
MNYKNTTPLTLGISNTKRLKEHSNELDKMKEKSLKKKSNE